MCTAVSYNQNGHFFGRNLDVEDNYGESIIITPRSFKLSFRKEDCLTNHYAVIGAGIIERGYPLYFDAANEYGLAMAGLNFVGNAKYSTPKPDKINITPYEFIPYILGSFRTVKEAMGELGNINLTDIPFSRELPLAELHWIIADRSEAITVEQTREGLRIYENRLGILTNNPPFPFHLENLNNYINVTREEAYSRFSNGIELDRYSRGMGAIGLPGDPSSASRFVRAAFTSLNSAKATNTEGCVCQLFHILTSVEQAEGVTAVGEKFERTEYSSVINLDTLTYYYRSYTNSRISAVRLFGEDIDAAVLITFPFLKQQSTEYQN